MGRGSRRRSRDRGRNSATRSRPEDRYPSATMMAYVEQNLVRPDQRQAYLNVLLDKIENDRFPSIDLMRRVQRLTG